MASTTKATGKNNEYVTWLTKVQPQVIRSQRQHLRYLSWAEQLMLQERLTPAETQVLELLAVLIERYETERFGSSSADGVDVLKELMAANGMKQADLTPFFGSKGVTSEVLNRRRRISINSARALAQHFKLPIDVFV